MISFLNVCVMKKRIDKIVIPKFQKAEIVRKEYFFEGKVKRLAFRNEVLLVSRRINLAGFVSNVRKGVIAEFEGTKEQIDFVVEHLKNVKRFNIRNITIKTIPLKNGKLFYKK